MNKNKNSNFTENPSPDDLVLDQLILDRLVDNDLSDAEYKNVLRLVEDKPDGWRQLALAFLESQAFEKELSAIHAGDAPDLIDPAASEKQNAEPSGSQNEKGDVRFKAGVQSVSDASSPQQKKTGFWETLTRAMPAIAACFVIAFAGALFLKEIQNTEPRQANNISDGSNGQDKGTVNSGFIELVSNDPNGRVQTPVYSHQMFDPQSYAQGVDSLKPGLREVVEQSGWNANEKTHMVPIKDSTGNKIIVPLKEIKLSPQGFEDYQ